MSERPYSQIDISNGYGDYRERWSKRWFEWLDTDRSDDAWEEIVGALRDVRDALGWDDDDA